MSWNYRVVRRQWDEFGDSTYAFHEAYYTGDGVVESITENPVVPQGDNMEDLASELELMKAALNYPFLDYDELQE
jgi:hypothetical protein